MAPLNGVHRVRKTNRSGRAEYWYAWRGGPCILAESATTDRILDLKVSAAAADAGRRYFEIQEARKSAPKDTVLELAKQWQASPEFKQGLSARTQKDYRRALAIVEVDLGTMPMKALKADGARAALLAWRNRYAATPANADQYAGAMSKLLGWARDQGLTSADPMRDWPWIYHPDRSDIVWKAGEIETVCAAAGGDLDLQLAILLAAYSGLRQCDLIKLTWSAVGEKTIVRRTSKRGRVVHIPRTPAVNQVLEACKAFAGGETDEKLEALTVLTRNGKPWKATTLNKAWNSARKRAIAKLPSIKGKRWHDLRGTYATSLHRDGYEDDEVDRIMGWKKGNSEQTRAAYVAGDVVAHTAIARAARRAQVAQAA
jgi:integrase